jgi:predicted MPP superfamily phosphohydrolase
MAYIVYLLAIVAIVGHFAFWIGAVNRLHATALPCWQVKIVDKLLLLAVVTIPAGIVVWWLRHSTATGTETAAAGSFAAAIPHSSPWSLEGPRSSGESDWIRWSVAAYMLVCWAVGFVAVPAWLWRRIVSRTTPLLTAGPTRSVDLGRQLERPPLGSFVAAVASRLPGNQILRVDIHEKNLTVPRLESALDGLSIAHLSDLHLTGQLTPAYYRCIVELTNELDADLVVITGDIVDYTSCIAWIPETLGKLKSRLGTFFVLGNHDQRVCDVAVLRRTLVECGLVDLGGRWIALPVGETRIMLAGNELPWFPPAADAETLPRRGNDGRPLRILLSHSPDQIGWARSFDFDIMLAGHTHGGQVCLPLFGPILSPSAYGVKYASGVFYEAPTLMHVSRGVASLHPIRYNCPPEIARLVLRRPTVGQTSDPRQDCRGGIN